MSAATKVFTIGAFDNLQSRGIRFLQAAAHLGDLTVLLWSDEKVRRLTGKPPKFPETERQYFLKAIRYVSHAEIASIDASFLPPKAGSRDTLCVVPESGANDEIKSLCAANGISYRVLGENDLPSFPKFSTVEPVLKSSRKKVVVTGCYDWLHSGHVRFFEEVSEHGDLHVVVGHDENVRLLKGAGHPMFSQDERRYVVEAIRYVKQAWVSSGNGWLDAEPEIQKIKPNIYAVNEDGDKPEKREFCERNGIEYLILKRTPAPGLPKRTSTDLRGS